jgi:hypothetical protein
LVLPLEISGIDIIYVRIPGTEVISVRILQIPANYNVASMVLTMLLIFNPLFKERKNKRNNILNFNAVYVLFTFIIKEFRL